MLSRLAGTVPIRGEFNEKLDIDNGKLYLLPCISSWTPPAVTTDQERQPQGREPEREEPVWCWGQIKPGGQAGK